MNMKKILAAATASVLTVGAMSVVASAKVTNPNGDKYGQAGKYVFAAGEDLGDNISKCTKVIVKITVDDAKFAAEGAGGGIATNNQPFAWVEFGNKDTGKAIVTDGKTVEFDSLSFEAGADAQVILEGWWGSDFSVDSISYLDKDGKVLATAGEKADDNTQTPGSSDKDDTKDPVPTGVGGVAAVLGVAVVAAGAMIVAKKRK